MNYAPIYLPNNSGMIIGVPKGALVTLRKGQVYPACPTIAEAELALLKAGARPERIQKPE